MSHKPDEPAVAGTVDTQRRRFMLGASALPVVAGAGLSTTLALGSAPARAALQTSARIVIAGSGPMEDLCKNCTLPNVKYVGFQTSKALEDLVAGALFTLHLSIWYENCPLALLESQSLGTPVLCNRIGGIPELVEEGRTGILNDTFTPAAYAEKIRALYADKPLLAEMSAHCIQKKDRMMTLERYCDQLLALYSDVLEEAR